MQLLNTENRCYHPGVSADSGVFILTMENVDLNFEFRIHMYKDTI